ncbi:MAG: ISLre2 family transposase, partial [Isosphaeraceae bacterium]
LSPGGTRLACLAAASWSFDVASDRLDALAGVRIDGETIRRHVHRAAGAIRRRREEAPPAALAEAGGDVEFLTDGVMVPGRGGWRELKMATFQARRRGEPAEVAEWADRALPAPTASVAYATVADSEAFSARWRPWAKGLGVDPDAALTVLADGAAWIWTAAGARFPGAAQVLDIFHASHHVAAAAAGLHGEGTDEAADWLGRGRAALLADGWPGLLDHVGATPAAGRTAAGQAALDEMIAYFAKHTDRLGYFGRLQSGRSIGSGAVEGLARRMGRRLKTPGRGWRVEHLDGMAALVATIDTPEWESLWVRLAA